MVTFAEMVLHGFALTSPWKHLAGEPQVPSELSTNQPLLIKMFLQKKTLVIFSFFFWQFEILYGAIYLEDTATVSCYEEQQLPQLLSKVTNSFCSFYCTLLLAD